MLTASRRCFQMLSPRLVGLVSKNIILTFKKFAQASRKRPVVSLFSGVGGLELAFSSPKPERDKVLFHDSKFPASFAFLALDSNSA